MDELNILKIIDKKRKRQCLQKEEIEFVIKGVVENTLFPEQVSALLMAICLNGMKREEIYFLTNAMANSGDKIDLSELYENENLCVDKHSSGGVSDSTTFIIAGVLAYCGIKMVKLSGKKLGFTGGTADKILEFTGYQNEKSIKEAIEIAKKVNVSLVTQTGEFAPADKIIYNLRDRTATVESIPLIASSIMSKKIVSGAGILLLDVKCGNGAFMKNVKDATKLAETMVNIGKDCNIKTVAFVTNMNQPLGCCLGNIFEAYEAVEILKGNISNDLKELSINICVKLVAEAKKVTEKEAMQLVKKSFENNNAFNSFEKIVQAHGGIIPKFDFAKCSAEFKAEKEGYVTSFNTSEIGYLANKLSEEVVNGGAILNVKIGSKIKRGDVLLTVHSSSTEHATEFCNNFAKNIIIGQKTTKQKNIFKTIV